MTGHPPWLRVSWATHRVADRLSGGRLGASYARKADRLIPVVTLEPRPDG